LSHPGTATAVDSARTVQIVEASWTRIQITIRLRPTDGRPLDATSILLRRSEQPPGEDGGFAPTHASQAGPDAVIRVNVMQGPDQMPLDPGRWVFVALERVTAQPVARERTTAAPLLVAAGSTPPTDAAAVWSLGTCTYQAALEVDPGDGAVCLQIEMDQLPAAAVQGPTPAGPGARRLPRPIRRLRLSAFRFSYRLIRGVTRRRDRRILFTSDSRSGLGGNLKLVHDRMVERGLDRDHELLTLFRPSIKFRRGFRDRIRLPWLLASAGTIVIDDYQPVIYQIDADDARIVQLWHAWGAFKTVGYSRIGKPAGLGAFSRIHKNYTYAIVSSDSEVAAYAEAFGIPEARVIPTGIPRMDRFFDPAIGATVREAALDAYPAARGRRVILFAPTFRGDGAKVATYDQRLLALPALHAVCVEQDAVCIIRMHPFVHDRLDIPDALRDRIIDGSTSSVDINDVLFATDLLITDYSSVVFEFSTQDRPMIFYAPDLDEYTAGRDFYVEFESFVPGPIARTFDELIELIRRGDVGSERRAAFRAEHLDHFDGRATDRVVDLIVGKGDATDRR
jgi:CDP-glycerol glycerophosphotransferase (TagB/SpsB family)